MRKVVVLVGACDGMERAQQIVRLLAAEGWRIQLVVGRSGGLDELAADEEAVTLVVMSAAAAASPDVWPWIERAPRDRFAILSFVDAIPVELHDAMTFDFRDWRGDRAQLWRSMVRWLAAPHARLDTRVWLKRA